jgi:phosphoribosylformylglycinamidine (FGAM) synthase-like enzyme
VQATALKDVKASGNWMYAAKLDGEGAAMYDAAVALKEAMIELEVAIDGGKDSLSMAAQAGGETVKCPGNLVISAYVTCPDITKTVTPDLKVSYWLKTLSLAFLIHSLYALEFGNNSLGAHEMINWSCWLWSDTYLPICDYRIQCLLSIEAVKVCMVPTAVNAYCFFVSF